MQVLAAPTASKRPSGSPAPAAKGRSAKKRRGTQSHRCLTPKARLLHPPQEQATAGLSPPPVLIYWRLRGRLDAPNGADPLPTRAPKLRPARAAEAPSFLATEVSLTVGCFVILAPSSDREDISPACASPSFPTVSAPPQPTTLSPGRGRLPARGRTD